MRCSDRKERENRDQDTVEGTYDSAVSNRDVFGILGEMQVRSWVKMY